MLGRTGIDADVVIVGGGLNGPLLAIALAQAGVTSTVIDAGEPAQRTDSSFDGRAYALSAGTRKMLGALGLWADLEPRAQPIRDIKVSDGFAGEGAGPLWLHFASADLDEGPLGHLLEDRHLRNAMLERAGSSAEIRMIWKERVVEQAIGPASAEVRLADGRKISGRVLVGCDGRNSPTARRAGIGRVGWDYGQMALVAAVAHERPHDGVAHQFFMPGGLIAILPLPGNRCSIVWTEPVTRAEAMARLDDDLLLAALRPRFGDFLGRITLEGARYSYPLSLSVAERMVANRLALVGDAAHGIHPLAGQGLNLGFRDVATLAETLVDAFRSGSDLGSREGLERYRQWRGFDAALLAFSTDVFNRVFTAENPVLRLGRAIGLDVAGRVPALSRSLAREAMGIGGDLPRLQRGLPL